MTKIIDPIDCAATRGALRQAKEARKSMLPKLGCRRCGGWGHIWLGNRDRETCDLCHGTGADPDQSVTNDGDR